MSRFAYNVQCESITPGIPCYRTAWAEGCPMPDTYLNGRPVYFGDVYHQGDAEDSYFAEAHYADTDEALSENELEQLTEENSGYLYEQWFEHQVCRAEARYEGDR